MPSAIRNVSSGYRRSTFEFRKSAAAYVNERPVIKLLRGHA